MNVFLVLKLTTQVYCGCFADLEDAKTSLVRAYTLSGMTCTFSNQGMHTLCTVSNNDSYLIRNVSPARNWTSLEGVQN